MSERLKILEWYAFGEPGMSSKAIAHQVGEVKLRHADTDWPHDVGDFRRCELLLRAVPTLRSRLNIMRSVGPEWGALVDAWSEIVELAEQESPTIFTEGWDAYGSTPQTYGLIRRTIDAARAGVSP